MSNQLLPCPFCGGKAEIESDDTDYPDHGAVCRECGARCHVTGCGPEDGWEWSRRAPPATTQPAAGEPVAWITRPLKGTQKGRDFICEPDASLNLDQWEKPFPVYAAPPAAGEPIAWADNIALGRIASGRSVVTLSNVETVDYCIPMFRAAPPAAAHGDEAVRKDAERYRWLASQVTEVALGGWSELYTDNRRAWKLPLLLSQNAVGVETSFGRAIDAAIRAQAGEGGEV